MKRKGVPARIGLAIAMLLLAAVIAAYCTPQEDPQPIVTDPPITEETTSSAPSEPTTGSEDTELPDTGGIA